MDSASYYNITFLLQASFVKMGETIKRLDKEVTEYQQKVCRLIIIGFALNFPRTFGICTNTYIHGLNHLI